MSRPSNTSRLSLSVLTAAAFCLVGSGLLSSCSEQDSTLSGSSLTAEQVEEIVAKKLAEAEKGASVTDGTGLVKASDFNKRVSDVDEKFDVLMKELRAISKSSAANGDSETATAASSDDFAEEVLRVLKEQEEAKAQEAEAKQLEERKERESRRQTIVQENRTKWATNVSEQLKSIDAPKLTDAEVVSMSNIIMNKFDEFSNYYTTSAAQNTDGDREAWRERMAKAREMTTDLENEIKGVLGDTRFEEFNSGMGNALIRGTGMWSAGWRSYTPGEENRRGGGNRRGNRNGGR